MQRLTFPFLLLCLAACGGTPKPAPKTAPAKPVPAEPAQPTTITLSILGTNDVHGRVQSLPAYAGYVRNLRAVRQREGGAVILLDGGDMFQGTLESNLTEGQPIIAAYNAMGVTAAAVGNHEFDYGPAGDHHMAVDPGEDPRGALKARAKEAKFPLLSANLLDATSNKQVGWDNIPPTTLVTVAGIKVGIIGLTTYETPVKTLPANFRGLAMAALTETAMTYARQLRAQGAEIVLITAHAGGECHAFADPKDLSSCLPKEEMFQALTNVPPGTIDGVVAGHTHEGVAHFVNGIPVIESFCYGRAFGRIDLVIDAKTHAIQDTRIFPPHTLCESGLEVDDKCDLGSYEGQPVTRDTAIEEVLAPFIAKAAQRRDEKLNVKVTSQVDRAIKLESPWGNLFVDLLRESAPEAEMAMVEGGSLRTGLPAGELTYGQMYQAFPFEGVVSVVKLTGAQLRDAVARNLANDKQILVFSGVRVVATCKKGKLDIDLIRDKGKPIKDADKLTVATSDYIASGGSSILPPEALLPANVTRKYDLLVRAALIAGLQKRGEVSGSDSRVFDSKNPRFKYPGPRPVTCR